MRFFRNLKIISTCIPYVIIVQMYVMEDILKFPKGRKEIDPSEVRVDFNSSEGI